MQRCQVRRILLAAACIQISRSLFCAPVDFLEIKLPSTRGSRRHLWSLCGIATVSSSAGAVDSGPTFRTSRKPPEIPVATAVILSRTTQEAASDWGGPFSKPGLYQTNFNKKRTEGFADFKQRYATYDSSGLFNQIELSDKDPRTNRLYFSFLNEVQFRTSQDGIKRRAEQERFGFNVGTRLYRKISQGDTVGPRISNEGDTYDPKAPVNMSSPLSGQWPPLSPPLPTGALATDLAEGSRRLMDYSRKQGYCKDFTLSSFAPEKDGRLRFESSVLEPVNSEATSTSMRSRGFPPRYHQRISQAYFADRGFDSEFDDELSGEAKSNGKSSVSGVRTNWVLSPDPDIGLD